MESSFRNLLVLLLGLALLGLAGVANAISVQSTLPALALGIAGLALSAWSAYRLRGEIGGLVRERRGEILLHTLGMIGILIAVAYLTIRFPARFDMTEARLFSLSPATINMLQRLEKPVHIVFFHDRMMRETVEMYQQIAKQSDKVTVEFYDPMLNPAQARMRGVEFPGTA